MGAHKSKRISQDLGAQLRALAQEILGHEGAPEELKALRDKSRALYEALIVASHQASSEKEEVTPIFELSTEKIKDLVAKMAPETQQMDQLLEQLTEGSAAEQEAMSHYQQTVEFEPIAQTERPNTGGEGLAAKSEKPKSLNDQLGRLSIGLNDRAAFIKHLFLGDSSAFEAVLTQIDLCESTSQVHRFLEESIMSKYNNWEGKKAIADRFIHLIEQRFKS